MNEKEKTLHFVKQRVYMKFRDQNQDAVNALLAYDIALAALCAEKLEERGHRAAADELRKMVREGQLT